jgi:ribosomal protein S18 acetylase RimI-like enzyme
MSRPTAHTDVHVRRAGTDDAPIVHALLVELATHEDGADTVHSSVEEWCRMLSDPSVVVLLAYDGESPVGYVSAIRQLNLWVGRDILAMDDLYVRADARDRGVGGTLMAALATHAARDDVAGPLLITWGVRADNEAGHRFYRRLGATLRTKVVAAWQPEVYCSYLDGPGVDQHRGRRR